MKNIKSLCGLILVGISLLLVISSFSKNLSADINITIPDIQIITTGNFNVSAAGGTIAVLFSGTANEREINSYLSSKNVDFLNIYTTGGDELMIELDANTSGIPIIIGISGSRGGYVSITQDCH